jgi:hypothetical protein
MRHIFVILAAFAVASPARTWAQPLILPLRDVAVEYRSSGMMPGPAGDLANTVMVRFTSDLGRLRIDGPYGRFYAILDIDAARLIVVMPEQRVYVDQPADPEMMAVFQATDTEFRRVGADVVAGLPCTAYDAAINDRTGQVCLTDDGVLLRARIAGLDHRPELDALSVTYARQPSRMFEVPAGYRRLNMPNLPFGMNPGPFGGRPRGEYPGGQFGR